MINRKVNRKRKDAECVENIQMKYKLQYSKILGTFSEKTTNQFRNIENLKFTELYNVNKFKEFSRFLF